MSKPAVGRSVEPGHNAKSSEVNAEWDGAQYTAVNDLQRWVADRSLAAVNLSGDEKLLDVGCGDGGITVELAGRLPRGRAVGIDPSPRMIEVALARISGGVPNLEFQLGSVETLTFAAEFDSVVSFNSLHWVADHELALRRIREALIDGGFALLQMVCAGDRQSVEQTAMTVCARLAFRARFTGFVPPFHHPDPAVFARQAAEAGFTVISSAVDDLTWDFGSESHFLAWCRAGFSAWMTRLPDESARAAFMQEVGDAYAEAVGSRQLFRFLQMSVRMQAS